MLSAQVYHQTHFYLISEKNKKVSLVGIEPTTFSLQERCSTTELKGLTDPKQRVENPESSFANKTCISSRFRSWPKKFFPTQIRSLSQPWSA